MCAAPSPAGIADATGIDYQKLLRIHMIGELTKVSFPSPSHSHTHTLTHTHTHTVRLCPRAHAPPLEGRMHRPACVRVLHAVCARDLWECV